jgi:acyl-CoA synthetase (AMP-forming)/AMP-acid ligase II
LRAHFAARAESRLDFQGVGFYEPQESHGATVATIIAQYVAAQPERPAIVMAKDDVLTYGTLGDRVATFGAALRANGIGPSARVALMLPDGAALAVAIVGTACHAVAVPINPKLTANELDSLFERLLIDAIVASTEFGTAARAMASRLGILLLETANDNDGSFKILSAIKSTASNRELKLEVIQPDNTALILQTSATSGRPKLVPVTHRSIVLNADRRRSRFNLTSDDRTLCAIPLYYGQGLNELFTALLVGGSVACPDREAGGNIIEWIIALRPTWYAGAGQAFHMNVLESAMARQKEEPLRHCLRFIRSGGAPLSETLCTRLEEIFGVPVLETYTFTEVAIVATNSIDPDHRKLGTVGRPWPNEVAIRADDGRLLPQGQSGEIVVRGPGLMSGYLDDDEANRAVFVDGWFRTGDVGFIDADGFLTMSGRLKEYINRGGEKISPNEVELALLLHPYIREAVAFAVPHPRMGENVAAAAVLMTGTTTTAKEIRTFLSDHLAPFKIPQQVFLKEQLPKGVTGKPLKRQLAEAAAARTSNVIPAWRPFQVLILEIWQRLLGRSDIGIEDDFFEAGGDSLLFVQMICEVEAIIRRKLPASAFRDEYTISALEDAILRGGSATADLITCVKEGHGTAFLFCHGDYQSGGFYALKLADMLTCEQPVFLFPPYADPEPNLTYEEMARAYIPHVLAAHPEGAFCLGGFCAGGYLAWEITSQLEALGREVEFLFLIDTGSINARRSLRAIARLVKFVVAVAPKKISDKFERDGMGSLWSRLWYRYPVSAYSQAIRNYLPPKIKARLICAISEEYRPNTDCSVKPWTNVASEVRSEFIAGTHLTCITTHVGDIASLLNRLLKHSKAEV